MYNLEFKEKKVTLENVKKFLNMIGVEDYEDLDHTFYGINFMDIRKWYMFKMKHAIDHKDEPI
jgi:hypothetical protein